jgi:hypothetical protein
MNPLIQLKTVTILFVIALVFVCFGLARFAQAVNPQPDGGYPGGNSAEGQDALLSLTTGTFNTANGFLSLKSNTTGNFNTAIGGGALFSNRGDQNTATGAGALLSNRGGSFNTANGEAALFFNTQGHDNTATGASALRSNTGGLENTGLGRSALESNTTGNNNTAIGSTALSSNTTGHDNTVIGLNAGFSVTTANNVICLGAGVAGANVDDSCYIGSIFGQTSSGGSAVFINANGKLGTSTSSRRFKDDIKPMEQASEILFALKPVTFRYKKEIDPVGTPQLGLVAEDVEKVNADLVVRDKEGKPYSVRYDQVNAMLLNEFLKEHRAFLKEQRKVEVQEKTIAELKSGMIAMAATLKEQAAQIQKVNAQLEASKPAPQVVNNP